MNVLNGFHPRDILCSCRAHVRRLPRTAARFKAWVERSLARGRGADGALCAGNLLSARNCRSYTAAAESLLLLFKQPAWHHVAALYSSLYTCTIPETLTKSVAHHGGLPSLYPGTTLSHLGRHRRAVTAIQKIEFPPQSGW